jgi:hypothetical protein
MTKGSKKKQGNIPDFQVIGVEQLFNLHTSDLFINSKSNFGSVF